LLAHKLCPVRLPTSIDKAVDLRPLASIAHVIEVLVSDKHGEDPSFAFFLDLLKTSVPTPYTALNADLIDFAVRSDEEGQKSGYSGILGT
jgi:hypothetical protein